MNSNSGFEPKHDSNIPSKEELGVINNSDGTTHAESVPSVDPGTEKRLLRKLDRRIIPCVCWIYLMNFMDRGKPSPNSTDKRLVLTIWR